MLVKVCCGEQIREKNLKLFHEKLVKFSVISSMGKVVV